MYVAILSPPPDDIMQFHSVCTPKSPGEGRCKEVTETNNSNISNTEPIDSVNAIYRLEIDNNTQMQRYKNVDTTDAERRISDWTEEVKFNENYDDNNHKFFDIVSEFKDMSDVHFSQASNVKQRVDLTSLDA